jgi:hypothetical protein
MPKFIRLFVIGCLGSGIHNAAFACEAQFSPQISFLTIPCITVVGDTKLYSAALQEIGDSNFAVRNILPLDLENPRVISLRVLTTPLPIAVIVAAPDGACPSSYEQPTFVQTGNNIDIRFRMRVQGEPVRSITDCALPPPVAQAVHLLGLTNPTAHTYSVNGASIAPNFSF